MEIVASNMNIFVPNHAFRFMKLFFNVKSVLFVCEDNHLFTFAQKCSVQKGVGEVRVLVNWLGMHFTVFS